MADLQSILKYITSHYPNTNRLSRFRLIKILYLADWRSALIRNKQITSLKWTLGECGLQPNQDIQVPDKRGFISFMDYPSLTVQEKEILDHAIKTSSQKNWTDFTSIVYSTYPILKQNSDEDKELNLIQLARLYNAMKDEQLRKDKTLFDTDIGIHPDPPSLNK
ncbi:hypothetical protein H6F93_07385 [Leptolyngbya sp. FACHB-671]|uniref:hypothetical protein n=1 Tax=Leptolyngbya sp. FACHB-671 TaxID=2692812 RepID=UPI001687256F|nr:hypothetical protein [Leptolyngbya sp. FACHB-671]MBD2067352.1 hypothetical protein [Leptolyngbya sp. FACHB-671]